MSPSAFCLEGRTVLVTGAASGIGRSTALAIAAQGGRVLALDRNEEGLTSLSEALGSSLQGCHHLDLTHYDAVAQWARSCSALDGVVHAAGVIRLFPGQLFTATRFDQVTENNYKGPVLLMAHLAKAGRLNAGCSIVFVSSMMSVVGTELNGLYSGTKGALVAMARCLAMELAPKEIRVNCVSPGFVETPMLAHIAGQTDVEPFRARHPLGFGSPEDVALPIVFLLSPASRWVTGTNLVVDGGYCAQ